MTVISPYATAKRSLFHRQLYAATDKTAAATTCLYSTDNNSVDGGESSILCDLQTLLKLTGIPQSGGTAKLMIQSGECQLNGVVEPRRAKKLFPGDVVTFNGKEYSVDAVVEQKGYAYKQKVKKVKPVAQVDEFGNKEFGGSYRSEKWRSERNQRKLQQKMKNSKSEKRNRRGQPTEQKRLDRLRDLLDNYSE